MNKLVGNYFSGSPKGLLSFFVKEQKLSTKDLKEIIESIDQFQEEE